MSETSSAAQRSASAAGIAKDERLRLMFVRGAIVFALALAVVALRLYRLAEIPPGIDAGEGANGMDALRVLQGEYAVFFPEKLGGREGLVMYAIALATFLLGRTELALRLPTALASAGTVFVVFWLGHLLFGWDEESGRTTPWRGLLVGGVGAGLMAVSIGLTIMGRTAFRTSLLPLISSNADTTTHPTVVRTRPNHTARVTPHASSTVCVPGGTVTPVSARLVAGWVSTCTPSTVTRQAGK